MIAPSLPGARVLPHDLEAEAAILGAILLGRRVIDQVAGWLFPSDFYSEHYAWVYSAALKLYEQGKPIDLVTLCAELEGRQLLARIGGQAALAELQASVPITTNAIYYGQLVKAFATRRTLFQAGGRIAAFALDDNMSESELMDRSSAQLFGVIDGRPNQDMQSLHQAMGPLWEQLHSVGKRQGLRTGFLDVDRLSGGLQPQNLVILAARPGAGKTSWALNVTEHVAIAEQVPVAYFSMEMSIDELGMRLACSRARVGMQEVRSGTVTDVQLHRLIQAHGQLSELPIWLDETPSLSPNELRAKARRAKLAHGVGLIVVDYLQLMEPKHQESRERGVAEVSRSLKSLAKELNIPILACAQLNREAERRADHRPQLSDLRDSGALEMDADQVLFIYRPRMYGENTPEDVAEVIVGKNRNGPTGTAKLRFEASQTRFLNRVEVHNA